MTVHADHDHPEAPMFHRRRSRQDDSVRQFQAEAMRIASSGQEPDLDRAIPPAGAAGTDSMEIPVDLRVPAPQEFAGTMMRYWAPLSVDGDVVACNECGAYRDWLVLNSGDHVWVRCRSAHETLVPGLDGDWYAQNSGPIEGVFGSREEGLTSFGYDGTFAGAIL
ncbi:hypothetical protein ACGFNX_20180 [Streptomyces sp. NPDC048723]|uniref:hypothetical protein n=1 Tax=Streptomyces sp. NPDC048723 TaxID=3365589 RepID=UPI0037109EF3